MTKTSEKTVEKYCQDEAKRRGGKAVKWSSPSQRGVPDRIIILPGKIGFLELKGSGKKPTKLQQHWIETLLSLGFNADYADSKEAVKDFMDKL